jgi:hypothetical protein
MIDIPRRLLLVLGALFAALVLTAIVEVDALQLSGLGGRYWSRNVAVSTSACVQDTTDAGSACVLFHAGTSRTQWFNIAVAEASATIAQPVTCCYTLTATGATVGSGWVTADVLRGAGGGACFVLDAAGDRDQTRPWATDIRTRPSGRAGICAGSVLSGGDRVFPPCSNTGIATNAAECTAYGLSGTNAGCIAEANWTSDQRELAGAFLVCAAASGTQTIQIAKERVQER